MTTKTIAIATIREQGGTTWIAEGVVKKDGYAYGKKGFRFKIDLVQENVTIELKTIEVAARQKSSVQRYARPNLTPIAAICMGVRRK